MKTKTFDVWIIREKNFRFCYSVEFINFICEIENSEIPGSFLFDKFLEGGQQKSSKIKYEYKKKSDKIHRKHIL